ncbi:hypothetical protein V8246_03225 [Pseudoxanthomonas sp. F11]|uniref:hypothetical protein n=1 Tax=Pseudoxanthomonas sp. F11 TaxID=3126308 RepID=UPI00300C23CF
MEMGDAQDERAPQVQRLLAYDGRRSMAMSPRMRMSGRELIDLCPWGLEVQIALRDLHMFHESIWNQLLGFVGFGFSVLGTHTHAQPEETHIH